VLESKQSIRIDGDTMTILRKCKKCGLPMEVIDAFDKDDQAVSMCHNCHILHHNQTNEDCSLYYIDKVKRKVNRK